MKKAVSLLLISVIFGVFPLGCTDAVTSRQAESTIILFKVTNKNGDYVAHLVNAYKEPIQFSFKQQCDPCRFPVPDSVTVTDKTDIPLDVTEGNNEQTLIVYDQQNNFYAQATFT